MCMGSYILIFSVECSLAFGVVACDIYFGFMVFSSLFVFFKVFHCNISLFRVCGWTILIYINWNEI